MALSLALALNWSTAIASDNPLDRDMPHASADSDDHGGSHADGHGAPPPATGANKVKPKTAVAPHAAAASAPAASGHGSEPVLTPEAAHQAADAGIRKLKEGNERYVTENAAHPRQIRDRRNEVAKGQKPFAIIVSCADSRVPPEIIFDQGLGDLFVVRAAGQVLDNSALGSIEYAVEHLNVSLIVVLGHERCGAVDAACKKVQADNHVRHLVEAIAPAVTAVKGQSGDLLANAVQANVYRVVDELKASWPTLAPRVRDGRLTVVGGVYDLDIGIVQFN